MATEGTLSPESTEEQKIAGLNLISPQTRTELKLLTDRWAKRYFFPGLSFVYFSHFCSFMVVWGLEFWGWGLGLGFLVWVFSQFGLGPVAWGLLGFFGGLGSQYIFGRKTLGKKSVSQTQSRQTINNISNSVFQ